MKDKELRKELKTRGVLSSFFDAYNFMDNIYALRAELKALKELLGVETVTHKGKALKKGKKEVEY